MLPRRQPWSLVHITASPSSPSMPTAPALLRFGLGRSGVVIIRRSSLDCCRLRQHCKAGIREKKYPDGSRSGGPRTLRRASQYLATDCGGSALLRRSPLALAHHVITATRCEPSMMGVRFWGQSRPALVTPEFRLLTQSGLTSAPFGPSDGPSSRRCDVLSLALGRRP
jgi:hypothetical protein